MEKKLRKNLQVAANFMSVYSLLNMISDKQISGRIVIEWNRMDPRIKQWTENGQLDSIVEKVSTGIIYLHQGDITGCEIGELQLPDLAIDKTDSKKYQNCTAGQFQTLNTFNTLLQMATGIGCAILKDTYITLYERLDFESEGNFLSVESLSPRDLPALITQLEFDTNYTTNKDDQYIS